MRLNIVKRIEHNHPGRHRHIVFNEIAAITITAKDFESCLSHKKTE